MHREAYEYVAQHAPRDARSVLDIGGRNINGSPRDLFTDPNDYTVIDILPGPGVDEVVDAADWDPFPPRQWECVVCCETFEHTSVWPGIVATAFKVCEAGGTFIATMAGPGRPVHSGVDGGGVLWPDEHYGNVDPDELRVVMKDVGWVDVEIDQQFGPCDVRVVGRKPR